MEWAKALNLPIVIHVREAFDALFEALDALNDAQLTGVVHCFTGKLNQAETHLGLRKLFPWNWRSSDLQKTVVLTKCFRTYHTTVLSWKRTALTSLLFLTVAKEMSRRTHAFVAQRVADLWEMPLKNVADITTQNARTLFNLSPQ